MRVSMMQMEDGWHIPRGYGFSHARWGERGQEWVYLPIPANWIVNLLVRIWQGLNRYPPRTKLEKIVNDEVVRRMRYKLDVMHEAVESARKEGYEDAMKTLEGLGVMEAILLTIPKKDREVTITGMMREEETP